MNLSKYTDDEIEHFIDLMSDIDDLSSYQVEDLLYCLKKNDFKGVEKVIKRNQYNCKTKKKND